MSSGGQDRAAIRKAYQTAKVIAAAVERGALSPHSALRWARRASAGEDVSVLPSLAGDARVAKANRRVAAHSNLAVLQQLTSALLGELDPADEEFSSLFPPGSFTERTSLIYDAPDQRGNRRKPTTVPGVEETSTNNRYSPYASASRYDDAWRITDAEGDLLWPPRTEAEAEARARAAAAGIRPYSDDQLNDLIFGSGA
jgi:hypothetical protein